MNHFGVFAKHPTPGRVKTRLAASIGEQAAADVYRVFLTSLLRNLKAVGDTREVSIAPFETSRSEFEDIAENCWKVTPQCAGDLGEKMRFYFDSAFAAGASRVVLIGSDSPLLTPALINSAFEELATANVVLGPTDDGGYYLVGARQTTPPIFSDMLWSTPRVWPETIARLQSAGVSYAELPRQLDIDDIDDLKQLHHALIAAYTNHGELFEIVSSILSGDESA